jgi:hypothetical protein
MKTIVTTIVSLALFVPALSLARAMAGGCESDAETSQRCLIIWIIATFVLALSAVVLSRQRSVRQWPRVVVPVIAVMLAGVALSQLDFGSGDRSRQKRTMADMRSIAFSLETFRLANGHYPQTLGELGNGRVPTIDAWGNRLTVVTSASSYRIESRGLCNELDHGVRRGEVRDVHGDLILENGVFVTYPQGMAFVNELQR